MAQKVVVVHSGARDGYQVARALHESGRLERLVTDLFWASDSSIAGIENLLPRGLRSQLRARHEQHLPAAKVKLCLAAGLLALILDKVKRTPFSWKRGVMRWADAVLGRTAGRLATRKNAVLLSYSYYGHAAFSNYRAALPGMLFQLHPHPASMRRILSAELERHPDCAASLSQEWELSLPEEDYQRLISETKMARSWLAASTFTKNTLIENGIPAEHIHVVPYGVNLQRFAPGDDGDASENGPLRLLFVGRINQRKGIKYLLEALDLLPDRDIHLTICGRVVDDLKLFERYGSRISIRPSVSHEELVSAYQQAELFVFPSVAEGFGHVLLESLACGLPVLSTTATAAPDLITEGAEGFVVEPCSSAALAARIDWALAHRPELRAMRPLARARAEQFTWERFRRGVMTVVSECTDVPNADPSKAAAADYRAVEARV